VNGLDLSDAAQRLYWSQGDSQALVDISRRFRESDPYTTWLHANGDRWYWTFLRTASEQAEAGVIEAEARLFGSYLDHLRGSLNYLTYQLAVLSLGEDPTLQGKLNPESVEFPIFDDSGKFGKKNRIKQLPQKYFDRIEAVQPYHGGHNGLWILHELAREYRHRVIHPVAFHPFGKIDGLFSDNLPPTAEDVDITYTGGGFKHGQDLCSFTTSAPFDPDDYPQITIAIGLGHPLCQGLTLVRVLNETMKDVVEVLNDWNGTPLSVLGPGQTS